MAPGSGRRRANEVAGRGQRDVVTFSGSLKEFSSIGLTEVSTVLNDIRGLTEASNPATEIFTRAALPRVLTTCVKNPMMSSGSGGQVPPTDLTCTRRRKSIQRSTQYERNHHLDPEIDLVLGASPLDRRRKQRV